MFGPLKRKKVLRNQNREYKVRNYRDFTTDRDLISFKLSIGESDLLIKANRNLITVSKDLLVRFRHEIISYMLRNTFFKNSLKPVKEDEKAPEIIHKMMKVGELCNVGPMAAVAGAIAESVGSELLKYSPEVIIENGGDIFVKSRSIRKVSIFAGNSPLSQKVFLNIDARENSLGICTSSGTVGPSLSFGKADAVTILSQSTALADAAATAIGNIVQRKEDIDSGLKYAKNINGVLGAVIIKDDRIGFWGNIEFGIIENNCI